MHELALTESLLNQVLAIAKAHALHKVLEVEVEAGALKAVVPEAMEEAFAILAQGTPAQGVRLKMTVTPVSVQCRLCEIVFEPKLTDFLCPQCRKADVRILGGHDIILKTITGE